MNLSINAITKQDITDVLMLMHEFAVFEKLDHLFEISADKLEMAMFGESGFVEGLIARDEGSAVAYALYYPHFASFRGERGLYLEDIYVSARYRASGIGRALLKRIAIEAAKRGFERIDFQVLNWNAPAIRFYESLRALRDDDERHFRFIGEAFRSLAAE